MANFFITLTTVLKIAFDWLVVIFCLHVSYLAFVGGNVWFIGWEMHGSIWSGLFYLFVVTPIAYYVTDMVIGTIYVLITLPFTFFLKENKSDIESTGLDD